MCKEFNTNCAVFVYQGNILLKVFSFLRSKLHELILITTATKNGLPEKCQCSKTSSVYKSCFIGACLVKINIIMLSKNKIQEI